MKITNYLLLLLELKLKNYAKSFCGGNINLFVTFCITVLINCFTAKSQNHKLELLSSNLYFGFENKNILSLHTIVTPSLFQFRLLIHEDLLSVPCLKPPFLYLKISNNWLNTRATIANLY